MRHLLYLLIFGSLTSSLFSCKKDALTPSALLSAEEKELLRNCRQNGLDNAQAITENLVGKWTLVGYACGFCAPDPKYVPSAEIVFTEGEGFFQLSSTVDNRAFSFSWELVEDVDNQTFRLETTPYDHALAFTDFCAEYILLDQRANDGVMYIFAKE